MTQEEKQLLLQDLSARLPYGVKVQQFDDKYGYKLLGIDDDELHVDCPVYGEGDGYVEVDYCKPYLRPMLSMAEEEKKEYLSTKIRINHDDLREIQYYATSNTVDWLNAHHFDYRGLIEKGLAIAVTEENNLYKKIKL